MSTVTISRANVGSEEVAEALRQKLGSRYQVTPSKSARFHHEVSDSASTVLVKRNWLQQAGIRIVPASSITELHINSASSVTLGGLIINRLGIVRKVHHALANAAELATAHPEATRDSS